MDSEDSENLWDESDKRHSEHEVIAGVDMERLYHVKNLINARLEALYGLQRACLMYKSERDPKKKEALLKIIKDNAALSTHYEQLTRSDDAKEDIISGNGSTKSGLLQHPKS